MGEFNSGIRNSEILRTDLVVFTEAIGPLARDCGLNPHTEWLPIDHPDDQDGPIISAISKTGPLNELRTTLQLGGNVGRILYADEEYRQKGFDYLFVYKPGLSGETVQNVRDLARRIASSMGIRVYVHSAQ